MGQVSDERYDEAVEAWFGAEIPGDHPGLEGDNELVRSMRFADRADIEARRGELEAVIVAWCRLKDG